LRFRAELGSALGEVEKCHDGHFSTGCQAPRTIVQDVRASPGRHPEQKARRGACATCQQL